MTYTIKSQYINQTKKNIWFRRIGWLVLILILISASFGSGMYVSQKNETVKDFAKKEVAFFGNILGKYGEVNENKLTQDVDFGLFWDVWDALKRDYVDKGKINEKDMFYGAILGMTTSLKDPYTVFMNPKISQAFKDDLAGIFEGVGMEIGIRDDILTVIAPLDGMPAQIAGFQSGDKIFAIDGESTAGITINEAVSKIRGQKGTQVTLSVFRNGVKDIQDITVTRSVIVVKSIRTEYRDDGIYVIKISNFNNDTLKLFNDAVKDVVSKNPSSIILDLRNNPGGYLDTAIELASEWIEDGVIVTEQFSENKKNEYLARGRARLKDYETIVLVNQGSASASEILAGALRDYEKANIVGMKTFGKGSVQSLIEFKDGSSVKITVAKWLTPNNECINDQGINPDIEVDLTIDEFKEDKDPQMDKAVELLNE